MLKSLEIYGQRNTLKIVLALNLLLVGTASLLYTNSLIAKLEEREENDVKLYARALVNVYDENADEDLTFITNEIMFVNQKNQVPTIYVDENHKIPKIPIHNYTFPPGTSDEEILGILEEELADMKEEHQPIVVEVDGKINGYIYYHNSLLLTQLRFFPYVLLAVMVTLGFLAYLAFSSARRAEQNRVWVGLAKETAHQLGTPLSSLMAWVEYLRSDPSVDHSVADEIEKDVKRLETIATRFSSIGSVPTLKSENIYETVSQFIAYLEKRISTKVKIHVENFLVDGKEVKINKLLFEWVVENICKNAVDAMGGIGKLTIRLMPLPRNEIAIDITDTGKGINKANLQKVFTPGYSTKKRGWGLGLTLAKRIIEEYHEGRLFVKSSEVGKGTTFRILLKENVMSEGPVVKGEKTVRSAS
ncbi:histidine kinase/DNA gyrase B/HSP90-like ATPase [Larkinella arboricola]|uniref:histidine kinase n=1 Tax=Larkinella arboricola TaxID=643671 RepID=A0A327WW62_LARAB|nr:HAMP domain-containing sensor histidine kinase [Larkinella arboricola]RAJ97557.1 histidine kinase/DNA gyrase B/HSP90-like ATPase [Larkinella arboricola]